MSDGKVAIMAAPSEEEHKEWLEALGELPAAKVAAEARVSLFAGRQDWRHSEVVVTEEQYATLVKEHGANFARQKQGGLFGKGKPAGPCEGCGVSNAPKFKGVFKNGDKTICELCYAKALPTPPGRQVANCTGMLSWRDSKKKWSPFFFALCGVTLEQHKGPEEYMASKPVVAKFDLGSARNVMVQDDGTIEVTYFGKEPDVFEVCFHAEEGKSVECNRWGKAMQDVLVDVDVEVIWGARLKREAFMKAKTKTMERLGDKQKEATLGLTRREVAKQEAELEEEEEGQVEEATEEAGEEVAAEDEQGAGEEAEEEEEEGAAASAASPPQQGDSVLGEDSMCSGVGRIDGSEEDHFLVLGKDKLSIYQLDAAPGGQLSPAAKPVGKVRLSSITDWVPLDTGFKLHRSDNTVKVDISSDAKKWHEALWGQLASGSQEEANLEEDLVLDSPGTPIFKGPLLLIEATREVPKIGLLLNASLQLREFENRAEDALNFAVATLQDAQVSKSGVLTLSFGGKEEASIVNLAVPENVEPGMAAWCSALNSLVQGCVIDANVRQRLTTSLGRSRASLLGQGGSVGSRKSADDDRKIREVFGFCSPNESGVVSMDNLIGACTRSALIQDFFNVETDPDNGLQELTDFIASKGFGSSEKALAYEEFKTVTLEWQEAHPRSDRPIRKSNLKSGKGAEVRSNSSPASPSAPRKTKRTEQEQRDKCAELCKTPRRWQENLDALEAKKAAQNAAKKKGQPKLFRINSHHAGHAATSLLVSGNGDVKGGVNVAALTRGMCGFTKATVSPKVNLHLGSPYPEKPWTDKVTNSARGGYVKPSEETPWKKINRYSTMAEDCSAMARGASAPPDHSRKRASCTEKVGQRGPDCLTTRPSTAHLKLGTASKITEQNRDPNYIKTKSGVDAQISSRQATCLEVRKAAHSGSIQKMKPLGH
mmetsp:Transcript_49342/g.106207  ORF Transcript_49342/g.106207 Transcript_49342/m.106207 type:complete len:937 (+) Transcript_49342:859-3669(+)